MDRVKIQVLGADGKYRGSLFKDGPAYKNRWTGAPKPSLQEVMICGDDDMRTGEWFLIEYVLPRQIIGDADCDSLFDEGSVCCRRTPVQALHWFLQQSFGPPPALVERVRSFAAQWGVFCGRGSARSMLAMLARAKFVDAGDPQFLDEKADDLTLLREIEVVREAHSSGAVSYSADSIVQDMGVDGFIAWMNGHLARVASVIMPKDGDTKALPDQPSVMGSTKRPPSSSPTASKRAKSAQETDGADGRPPVVRVSYQDVCRGRPDLKLPRTAKSTYTRWCRNPMTASDLGVNPKGLVAAQQPLVEGLIRLHAQKSTKRRPPKRPRK